MRIMATMIMLMVLLSGCSTTEKVWDQPHYYESVSAFTINENNNLFIATGKEHAYVFEISKAFKQALIVSREITFTPSLSDFTLRESGEITGDITLTIASGALSEQIKNELVRLGFSQDDNMTLHYTLNGNRYQLEETGDPIQLANHYPVKVIQASSTVSNVGKVIITPGAVVVDSALMVTTGIPTAIIYGVLGAYMYADYPTE